MSQPHPDRIVPDPAEMNIMDRFAIDYVSRIQSELRIDGRAEVGGLGNEAYRLAEDIIRARRARYGGGGKR